MVSFWFGVREGMLGAYCWLLWLVPVVGWDTFPQFLPGWFNDLAGVTHSQAIWPQPWYLKHWRELVSLLLVVPLAIFGPLGILSLVLICGPCAMASRYAVGQVVCPRPVWQLWELGQPGVYLSVCPLPWPLFWALVGLLPCPALVRAAINLAIWFPNSSSLYRLCSHGRPSTYLFRGFFIFTLCLVGSNHQLGISGPGIAINISYWISNMLADPMEGTIFEMLLHL